MSGFIDVRDGFGRPQKFSAEQNGEIFTPIHGLESNGSVVGPSNPLPVDGPLTNAQLRNSDIGVTDIQNKPVTGTVPFVLGSGNINAGRGIYILATQNGTANLVLSDGSFISVDIGIGGQLFPFSVVAVGNTSPTGTYYNLL